MLVVGGLGAERSSEVRHGVVFDCCSFGREVEVNRFKVTFESRDIRVVSSFEFRKIVLIGGGVGFVLFVFSSSEEFL